MRCQRRYRTKFTKVQIAVLEEYFLQEPYIKASRLADLSSQLTLGKTQVKIWFKNRRRRHKIRSTKQYGHLKENSKATDATASKSGLNDTHLEWSSNSGLSNSSSGSLSSSANNLYTSNEEFDNNLYLYNQYDASSYPTQMQGWQANALPEHNYQYATTTTTTAAAAASTDATALLNTTGYQPRQQTVELSELPSPKRQRLQMSPSSQILSETATNKPETDYNYNRTANCRYTMSSQPFKVHSPAVKVNHSEMVKSNDSTSICDGNGVNQIDFDFDNKKETNTKPSTMLTTGIYNNIINHNYTSNHDYDNNNSKCIYNTPWYTMEDCSKAYMKLHQISFDEIFEPSYDCAWDALMCSVTAYDPMQQFSCYYY